MLSNTTFLITGIADKHSLAMFVAKQIIKQGGKVVCTGLGVSKHHTNLSEKAKRFLNKNYEDFKLAVFHELGDTHVEILDASLDENIDTFAQELSNKGVKLNGFLHAIAMDKTIRKKEVKPLLDITKDEFSAKLAGYSNSLNKFHADSEALGAEIEYQLSRLSYV